MADSSDAQRLGLFRNQLLEVVAARINKGCRVQTQERQITLSKTFNMNSTSLCKDCGHSQKKHNSTGMCHFLSLVDELDWETRHCQCRFFRPEPAPEKDSVDKIVGTWNQQLTKAISVYEDSPTPQNFNAIFAIFEAHGKAEREKGIQEEAIKCYEHSQASFTKGIEAAKEVVKNIRRFEGKEGFDMWQAAIDTIETDLNSLKETNTK